MKLFLLITLFSSFAFASQYNYKSYWSDSGYVKADKQSSFKVLIKRSPLFTNSQIAVMTVTKNNKETKSTVVNLFKASVGKDCTWRLDNIDGLEIHECASLKTGALFRLAYNNKTQEFSTGSVALRYLLPSYAELHLLQAEQLTGVKASAKKTAWLMELFIQKAYAQTVALDIGKYLGTTGNNILGSTNTSLQSLNGTISNAGSQISGSVNNIAGAGNNIAGSINNISTTGNNLAGAGNNIAGSINNASVAGNNIAGAGNNLANSANNVAGSINNASNTLNSTVNDTLSAKNVAKLSAVAGLTFGLTSSLGSMAANFLVNGSYTMLRTLFYEAKGEFTPEQKKMRLERFEKSLKTFQELEPSLNEMASKLAIASAELTLASGVTQEEFIASLDRDITAVKEYRADQESDGPVCTEDDRALRIRQLEDFKKIVVAADRSKPKVAVCENIESLYKNWVNAEYALLNSRRLIMQDLRLFNGTIIDGIESQTNFQENRKLNNACLDSAESKLNKVKRELNGKNCDDDISSLLCQKYEAYKGMVESCKEMAEQKSDARDEAELITATSNVSKVLAQFSRELGALSCDSKTGCTPGKLDRVRTDIKDIFASAAKQCPNFFFAKQVTPRTPSSVASPQPKAELAAVRAPAEADAADPAQPKKSFWSRIKGFFGFGAKKVNQEAAEEVVAGQN